MKPSTIWALWMGRQTPAEFLALIDAELGQGMWRDRLDATRAVVQAKLDADPGFDWTGALSAKRLARALLCYAEAVMECAPEDEEAPHGEE